jgi:ankyrin repeat protein
MKTRLRTAGLIVVLAAVIQPALGETPSTKSSGDSVQLPPGEASVVLPLTHAGAWLCTKVSIDGKDAGWFVIDTGSEFTVVDTDPAMRLGLKRLKSIGSANVATCQELKVGPLTSSPGIICTGDLARISSIARFKVGGLLGSDFLASHPFTLDWRAGTLTMYRRDKFTPPAGIEPRALQLRSGFPSVKATVAGFTGWFMLDIGDLAGVTLDPRCRWATFWRTPVEHWSQDSESDVRGTTSGFATVTGPNEILGTNTEALRVRCYETDLWTKRFLGGRIGSEYLSQWRLTFDYSSGRLWAQRYADADTNDWYGDSADVNRKDLLGRTPLMQAAVDGNVRLVDALVRKGARVNDTDAGDYTALTLAAINRRPAVVRALLAAHADTEVATVMGGLTSLHLACAGGDLESVNALLDSGAKVDGMDVHKRTPLMAAAAAGYPKVVERLLRSKAKVNFGAWETTSALAWAAGYGDAESVAELLAAGAEVNPVGKKPLVWAAGVGNVKAVELLLKHGADINAKDDGGKTALMRAVENGSAEAVDLLLKSGADPIIKTSDGHTAFDLARDPTILRALVTNMK